MKCVCGVPFQLHKSNKWKWLLLVEAIHVFSVLKKCVVLSAARCITESHIIARTLLLSEAACEKRLQRSKIFLNNVSYGNRVKFFFDEKTFNVDPADNCCNNRIVDFARNVP